MPGLQALQGIPSFGGQLGQALGTGLTKGISSSINNMLEQKKQMKTGQALATYLGKPEMAKQIGQFPLDIQKEIAKSHFKQKEEQGLQQQEYDSILDEMENALNKGEAGKSAYIKSYFSPELQESTARFQSQGTALLGLAQKIALKQGIRNQREFDVFLKRTVPNESDTIATAKGKIKALRDYNKTGKIGGGLLPKKTAENTSNTNVVLMKDPSGKLRNVPKKDVLSAQKEGYKLER